MNQSSENILEPEDDLVEVRSSRIHGNGVFARKAIPAGSRALEYRGEIVTKTESIKRCSEGNDFLFGLNEESDLDGNVSWNPARHVNHSCDPNCDAELIDGRIFLIARRNIDSAEELSFNYGYDLVDFREHPCRCGSPKCVGYIVCEDLFDVIRARRAMAESLERELSESNVGT